MSTKPSTEEHHEPTQLTKYASRVSFLKLATKASLVNVQFEAAHPQTLNIKSPFAIQHQHRHLQFFHFCAWKRGERIARRGHSYHSGKLFSQYLRKACRRAVLAFLARH
jgi:hypothetical protein